MTDASTPEYDPGDFPPFAVTVDVVVFTIRSGALHVALVRRGDEPFLAQWALPGGFVRPDEDLGQAATRELEEETGLRRRDDWHLEQLGSYGTPDRDPRMRVVTVAYMAVCADVPELRGGGDAAYAELRSLGDVEPGTLAFDHERIVRDAVERVGSKLEYTTLATGFLEPVFTISELRRVYEIVWGDRLDKGNFQRRFRDSACFEPCLDERRGRGRPASLWSVRGGNRGRRLVVLLDRPLARRRPDP